MPNETTQIPTGEDQETNLTDEPDSEFRTIAPKDKIRTVQQWDSTGKKVDISSAVFKRSLDEFIVRCGNSEYLVGRGWIIDLDKSKQKGDLVAAEGLALQGDSVVVTVGEPLEAGGPAVLGVQRAASGRTMTLDRNSGENLTDDPMFYAKQQLRQRIPGVADKAGLNPDPDLQALIVS